VVLLILAGITITYVMGDNSIFKKAQEAAGKTNQAGQDELEGLNRIDNFIKKETNKKPIIKRIGVVSKTINSLTIEAIGADDDKEQLKYKLYIGNSKENLILHSEEKEGTSNVSVQWEVLSLQEYTKYFYKVEVTDGIDIVTTDVKEVMTNRTNTTPTVANSQIEEKTINSMIIKANATDAEDDKLIYTIYFGETADKLTKQTTMEEQNKGEGITFTKTDLKEYTLYYYRIDVSDEWDTTEGVVQEVRTYCSGKGAVCEGTTTCTHCNEEGKCSYRGKSSSTTNSGVFCSRCNTTQMVTTKTYTCGCNGKVTRVEKICNARGHIFSGKSYSNTCGRCQGTKIVPCSHGKTEQHEICSHNKVGQHDD